MNKKQQAYQEQVESQLNEWAAKIAQLKAKAGKAEAQAKVKYHEEIEEMQAREKNARAKLAQLKEAGADAWESLRQGVENAMEDLKTAGKH